VRTFAFAALGFATALTVAWSLAAATPEAPRGPMAYPYLLRLDLEREWPLWVTRDESTAGVREVRAVQVRAESSPGDAPVLAEIPAEADPMVRRAGRLYEQWSAAEPRATRVVIRQIGWPARCLWGWQKSRIGSPANPNAVGAATMRYYGHIGLGVRSRVAFGPKVPAWRKVLVWYSMPVGLAVNTALYGAWWLAVVLGARAVLRWRRRRRGLCARCGYDLRGLGEGEVCPECGPG